MKLATIFALIAVALNISNFFPKGHPAAQFVFSWFIVILIVIIFLDRNPGGPAGGN